MKCDLGHRRMAVEGAFVFGEGATGSIMFVGEGPGVEEEREGRPFVGRSGRLLRRVLEKLGLTEYYITNLVTCRSCTPQTDAAGNAIFRTNWQTKRPEQVFKDEPPTPPQYLACLPRLHEEIYLVDPTVIVGLGGKACEALMSRRVTITRDRGEASEIEVPGASFVPVLTEKKQEWARRAKGTLVVPTAQNMVRYHFIPTLHPAYVARTLADQDHNSPFRQFVADLRKAIKTHELYQEIVFGVVPLQRDEVDDAEMHQSVQEDE